MSVFTELTSDCLLNILSYVKEKDLLAIRLSSKKLKFLADFQLKKRTKKIIISRNSSVAAAKWKFKFFNRADTLILYKSICAGKFLLFVDNYILKLFQKIVSIKIINFKRFRFLIKFFGHINSLEMIFQEKANNKDILHVLHFLPHLENLSITGRKLPFGNSFFLEEHFYGIRCLKIDEFEDGFFNFQWINNCFPHIEQLDITALDFSLQINLLNCRKLNTLILARVKDWGFWEFFLADILDSRSREDGDDLNFELVQNKQIKHLNFSYYGTSLVFNFLYKFLKQFPNVEKLDLKMDKFLITKNTNETLQSMRNIVDYSFSFLKNARNKFPVTRDWENMFYSISSKCKKYEFDLRCSDCDEEDSLVDKVLKFSQHCASSNPTPKITVFLSQNFDTNNDNFPQNVHLIF